MAMIQQSQYTTLYKFTSMNDTRLWTVK